MNATRVMTKAVLAALLGLGLAACGGGGGSSESTPVSTTTPTPVTEPTPQPPAGGNNVTALSADQALALVNAWLTARNTDLATAVPATAAAYYQGLDGCYQEDGFTRPYLESEFNIAKGLRSKASFDYLIGSTRTGAVVKAVRFITAGDGSTRNEIDAEFDQVNPREGTTQRRALTFVHGSTVAVCAGGVSSSDVRLFGNQRRFVANILAINQFQTDWLLATGAAATPAQIARRALRFDVRDPQNIGKYAVVTRQSNAAWSLKLLSPRVLESSALNAKPGNYLSGYSIEESFRICANAGGSLAGSSADCGLGATASDVGVNLNGTFAATTLAAAQGGDANWTSQIGIARDEEFRFELFNDDGWQQVGGHIGKTPVASYTERASRLPYTFVELLGGGAKFVAASAIARDLTTQAIGAAFTGTANVTDNEIFPAYPVLPDGQKFGRQTVFLFTQGAATAAAAGAFWPARRSVDYYFAHGPSTSASTSIALTIPGKPADVRDRSGIQQIATILSDRDSAQIRIIDAWR